MTGYIVLEGGAEFGGQMAEPDRRSIELAGGPASPIRIIPTAAAPDNNHQRAGRNGVNWFKSLGATDATSIQLIDKTSANSDYVVQELTQARLIYLLGGFPAYLGQTLTNSKSWQAMLRAYEQGAVIAGSSAGAMVLCQYYSDPQKRKIVEGLGLLPNTCVLPHHNTFGKGWAQQLAKQIPQAVLIGIDEQTGMIDDGDEKSRKTAWRVYGKGSVTLYRQGTATEYKTGTSFSDDFKG